MNQVFADKIYNYMVNTTNLLKKEIGNKETEPVIRKILKKQLTLVLKIRKEYGFQFPEIEETALLLGLKEEDIECMML